MKKILLLYLLGLTPFWVNAEEIDVTLPLSSTYEIQSTSTADTFKFSNGTIDQMILMYWDAEDNTLLFTDVSFVTGGEVMCADLDKGTLQFEGVCNSTTNFVLLGGNIFLKGDGQLLFSQNSTSVQFGTELSTWDYLNLTLDVGYLGLSQSAIEPYSINALSKYKVIVHGGVIDGGVIIVNAANTGDIVMGAASVNSALQGNVIDVKGNPVYQVKLPHNNDQSFTVQKDDGTGVYADFRDYSFIYFHKDAEGKDDPNYYIYLPNGNYSVTTGTETYTFTVDGEAINAAEKQPIAGDGIVDLSNGAFAVIDGGYQIGDQPYTYDGANGYTFTGTTTGTVVIPADFPADHITLHNLTIDRSAKVTNDAPITIEKTDTLAIVLSGNSQLKVKSGGSGYGSVYNSGDCILTVSGTAVDNTDTLKLAYRDYFKGGKLIIKSGNINKPLEPGFFYGDSLVIDGGVVSTGVVNPYGETVINGGELVCYYYKAPSHPFTINGGMVNITFYADEAPEITETIKINGGSVYIRNANTNPGSGIRPFAKAGCPTRTGGTGVIYQSIYKLPVPIGTKIDAITIDGTPYPCNDVYTDTANCVYLWLPETEDVGHDPVTNVTITAGGVEFKFRGYVDTQFEYVPYKDDMNPGQGNKQEMIPLVSVTTQNGSFELSGAYTALFDNTLYACSGSQVSITATPDTDYELDSIAVNGTKLTNGDMAFTVVRPDQPITQMEAAVRFKEAVRQLIKLSTANGSFELSGHDVVTQNDEQFAKVGAQVTITVTPDTGYELDSIAVNGTKLADGVTTFTVDGSATQMEISVGFKAIIVTAINNTDASTIKVFGVQNAVCVRGTKHAQVQIISLSGIKVYEAHNVSSANIPIKPGIYVVVVDNRAHKVMVR